MSDPDRPRPGRLTRCLPGHTDPPEREGCHYRDERVPLPCRPHRRCRPGHEQVVFCQDRQSGLRAIIAIYSTALGPALGDRFYPYPDEDAALSDVLNLSRAMAYKNALAGLDHGGGKAVIIGDPATLKSEACSARTAGSSSR